MASSSEKLKDKDFQNWLKAALGISIVKKGIEPYVCSVIEKFHLESLKDILSVEEIDRTALCCTCTNKIILKTDKPCPKKICDRLKGKISLAHFYGNPSWKNTRVENWIDNPWEIAKCYLPPDGYVAVSSSSETDLNGILSVMINHMEFIRDKKNDEAHQDICKKTREVTNAVRHSPNLSMSDKDLNEKIEVLITFLESYRECNQAVVEALGDLKKLKEATLKISTDEVTEVLRTYIREEIKDKTAIALNQIEHERNESLQTIIDEINKLHSTKSESLDDIFNAKLKEVLVKIDEKKASAIDEINRRDSFKESPRISSYETLKQKLYDDLLVFNKKLYSTIPLSPLFEKEDTPFEEIYVQPNMNFVEHPLRKSLRADIKTEVTCLSDILTEKLKNNIYVISKSGLGKTVLCKRLVMAWCFARDEDELGRGFEKEEDLKLMKAFDFAFLVPLRESRTSDCDIDTMILHQIISNLARSERYSLDFLQDILTKERCLIILDGLDEWTHPKEKHCKTKNDIPHRKAREHCTILTTTRTWKYYLLSLSRNEIDILVQITGLDDSAVDKLVDNAVSIFSSENVKYIERDKEDFRHKIQKESISKLKNVPLIVIHLICLWYKDHTIGDSLCEIFSNIIGLHVQRAKARLNLNVDECSSMKKRKVNLPYCITKNTVCEVSYDLLKSLAELAFYTYFDKDRENSLAFDINMAKRYLKHNLDFSMATGLLSQTKDLDLTKPIAPRVSFAHKTFQEYFAALHMFFSNDVEIEKRTIKTICNTVDDILSVTNFLIFLSGMCPDKAQLLFQAFSRVITTSETVKGYRSDMGSWNFFVGYNETIKRLQTLFVDCMDETIANKSRQVHVLFEDFIIDSEIQKEGYSRILKLIIEQNGKNVKSVKLRDLKTQTEFQNIIQLLRKRKPPALEKIDVKCDICDESLELLLQDSERSLKCFIIKGGHWMGMKWTNDHVRLSNRSLQFIWSMGQLEELYLRTIEMTHGQLEQLFSFVTRSSKMKHIGLGFLKCSQHNDSCEDLKLDLASHSHLRMLEIGSLPLSEVKVNTQSLEVCYVGGFKESSILCDILRFLSQARILRVFCCGFLNCQEDIERMLQTIASLKMLQHLWLIYLEFGDMEIRLSKEMKEIKELFLNNCKMSFGNFQKLVHEVKAIEKNVIVGLFDCTVDPHEDFEREIQHIKSTQTIQVIQDEQKDNQRRDLIFKTLADRNNV